MMKLKNILLERQGRTQQIDMDTATTIFDTKCSGFRKMTRNDTHIYRVVERFNRDFGWVQPSKHSRISRNTQNYYTLLMDNSSRWKNYPKRSKSIIARTDSFKTSGGSMYYLVIPTDNSKIGVCPEYDLWFSFKSTFDKSMNYFNVQVRNIIHHYMDHKLEKAPSEKVFFGLLKNIDEFKRDTKVSDDAKWELNDFELWQRWYNTDKPFIEVLENALDPNKNGFDHTTWPDKNLPVGKEVWTDGDCLLIRADDAERFFNKVDW